MTTPVERNQLPAEAFFITSAISLYLGAAIAVSLFDRLPPGAVALNRVAAAGVIFIVWRRPWNRRWKATIS